MLRAHATNLGLRRADCARDWKRTCPGYPSPLMLAGHEHEGVDSASLISIAKTELVLFTISTGFFTYFDAILFNFYD